MSLTFTRRSRKALAQQRWRFCAAGCGSGGPCLQELERQAADPPGAESASKSGQTGPAHTLTSAQETTGL